MCIYANGMGLVFKCVFPSAMYLAPYVKTCASLKEKRLVVSSRKCASLKIADNASGHREVFIFVCDLPKRYVSHLVVIVKEVNSIYLDPEEERMCLSVKMKKTKISVKKLCTEKKNDLTGLQKVTTVADSSFTTRAAMGNG